MVQSRQTREKVVVPEDTLRLKRIETQLCLMTKLFMDGADPILVRDLQRHVLEVNHEFERVFDWSRDELIGGRTIHLVAAECLESIEEVYRRRLSGEAVRNFETIMGERGGSDMRSASHRPWKRFSAVARVSEPDRKCELEGVVSCRSCFSPAFQDS